MNKRDFFTNLLFLIAAASSSSSRLLHIAPNSPYYKHDHYCLCFNLAMVALPRMSSNSCYCLVIIIIVDFVVTLFLPWCSSY